MPFRNVVDDSSTSVSSSTPGVTVQLTNHTTHRLRGVGVPVRFKVCVNTTAANDTGAVKLMDSTGTPVITVLCNNPAATTSSVGDWYWADGYLPASEAKYDVHYGGNTLGSLTVFSASCYEIDWTTDPVTGSASMTLGALTVSADGGFRGEASLTLGELTVSAIGDGHGDASLTLDALTVASDGTVVNAAPTYQAIGTQVGAASGSLSPGWGTHATDDYAICIVVTNKFIGDPGVPTLTTANGFSAVTGGADSTTDGTSYCRVTLFEARATSGSMSAPTIDTGTADNGVSAVIVSFRGCTTSGGAVDVAAISGNSTSNTSVSVTGATTTGVNRAVLLAVGYSGTATCGSFTNSNLTSITERLDATVNAHIVAATATAASSGDYGSSTATLSVGSLWAAVTVALKA